MKQSSGMTKTLIFILSAGLVLVGGFLFYKRYKKIYGKSEYISGSYSNKEYRNDYFGIQASLGPNWDVTKYIYDGEAEKKALDNKQMVNELYAQSIKSVQVVGFFVQQTPYNVKESGKDINKMLDLLKGTFQKQMEESGYKVHSIERDSLTIAGENCEGFKIVGSMQGNPTKLSLVQYYVFKGNYMGAYTASSTTEDKAKKAITQTFVKQ